MSDQHDPRRPAAQPAPNPPRGFSAPRLELPRFQFSPTTTLDRSRPQTPATPQAAAPQHPHVQYQAAPAPTPSPAPARSLFAHPHSTRQAAPAYAPASTPAYQHTATAMAQPVAVAAPAPAPAPTAAPAPIVARPEPVRSRIPNMSATSPASVGWSMPAAEDKTLLQKITPIHMGVFLVLVVMMMVVTAGPSSMHATPTRLPALVSGGGTADGIPMQPRAGVVAVNGAANAGAPKARAGTAAAPRAAGRSPRAAVPRARTLRVGSASVPARVHAGGIPSPAAAANLAISGGGRVGAGQTGAVRMNGIPSPAAAAQLGPQKLPFKPSDGVTLPRTVGERDSHAIDTHYSAASLPMEEPAAPVMTPGQSSAYSERQVTLNELTGGTSSANPLPASPAAGGYANAY